MRAIVVTKFGSPDNLELMEVEKPTPEDNEVLIKVHAATVTIGDTILLKLRFPLWFLLQIFGMKRKKLPGHEFSGIVEAVGQSVTKFEKGDQVFGTTSGLDVGANAEYVCLPEEWSKGIIALKPTNMSYEEAAAVPIGGMTALHILRKGDIQYGQKVLVYGASGSVGSFAVQIAKAFGAEVTGVCSTTNLELVKSLGANKVIDYTKEDFTKSGEIYDVIFDAVIKTSARACKKILAKGGKFLSARSSTKESTEILEYLKELIEAGKLKSAIDRTYPLNQVPEAYRYVNKGHKKGNVVILVQE
ncbi:MAG: NAD(P)-dependent alcohol dehydrogenase [Candidatus Heimdallarchaeota archaeon]|nr:MAG: NAD(P)-dependent alcohol dehydrogenase [Candidatus Heimdallarchaeota archaeon]